MNCSSQYTLFKRWLDLSLAWLGLLGTAPLVLLIALLIRLESPGPIFFVHPRLGKGGRVFDMIKFRKFHHDVGDSGPGVTVRNDVRMTRVGRILERTKFDELPQLWNIVLGEMTFVGPRPESLRYADLFDLGFADLLKVKPGIFGPCQVAFRNESFMYPPGEDPDSFYRTELFPRKARIDLSYFSRPSLKGDLRWIVLGILASVTGILPPEVRSPASSLETQQSVST